MTSLNTWRALARVELRQFRRHPGRAWLVILLVAVPVAAMVGGSCLLTITQRTSEELSTASMGQAELRLDDPGGERLAELRALLPSTAQLELVGFGHAHVAVPGRRLVARTITVNPTVLQPGGLAHGLLQLVEGQPPHPGEVALSPLLLEGLQRSLGETVTLLGDSLTISGVVVDPEKLSAPVLVLASEQGEPAAPRALLIGIPAEQADALAKTLEAAGLAPRTRAEEGATDDLEALLIFVVGGFGCFEAALIISAAFAVGLRRRQREIGLLGASGAPTGPMHVTLFLSAGVLALLGGLLGSLVGVACAAALRPFLDDWNGRLNGPFEVSAPHVAGALLLGMAAAVSAAALPARNAIRLPIRWALGGRRPVAGESHRWLGLGITLVCVGLLLMFWGRHAQDAAAGVAILAGSVAALLGFGATSPWILGFLARFAAPLPLPWRLAVRDAGRYRARHGPAVTAVLAGMSISVLVATLVTSLEAMAGGRLPQLRDDQLLVEGADAEALATELHDQFDGVGRAPLAAATRGGELLRARFIADGAGQRAEAWVACGGDALLDALGIQPEETSAAAAGLLSLLPGAAEADLSLHVGSARLPDLPALRIVTTDQAVSAPLFILAEKELAGMGLQASPPPGQTLIPWVVRLRQPLSADQLLRAQALAAQSLGSTIDAAVLQRSPSRSSYRAVLLICLLTGLIVIAVATSLTATESAADSMVLHTVGASPALLRHHQAARAAYLALLGCTLAIPAGMIPAFGLLTLSHAELALQFLMPWPEILIAVLGLPALAYGGTWAFAWWRTPRSEPNPSTR